MVSLKVLYILFFLGSIIPLGPIPMHDVNVNTMKIKLLINNNFLISFIYSTSNFPIKIILLFSELYYNQILLSNFVNKSFLLIYNIINRLTIKK